MKVRQGWQLDLIKRLKEGNNPVMAAAAVNVGPQMVLLACHYDADFKTEYDQAVLIGTEQAKLNPRGA